MSREVPRERAPIPLSVKLMNLFAAAGWLALLPLFIKPERFPAALFGLRNICLVFSVSAAVSVAVAYAAFRATEVIARRRWRNLGWWTALPTLAFVTVAVFGGLRAWNVLRAEHDQERDLRALQAGLRAERAEKFYFTEHKTYTAELSDLLQIDANVAESPEVTFKFYRADQSGYRFATHSAGSPVTYPFSNQGLHPFGDVKVRRTTASPKKESDN